MKYQFKLFQIAILGASIALVLSACGKKDSAPELEDAAKATGISDASDAAANVQEKATAAAEQAKEQAAAAAEKAKEQAAAAAEKAKEQAAAAAEKVKAQASAAKEKAADAVADATAAAKDKVADLVPGMGTPTSSDTVNKLKEATGLTPKTDMPAGTDAINTPPQDATGMVPKTDTSAGTDAISKAQQDAKGATDTAAKQIGGTTN